MNIRIATFSLLVGVSLIGSISCAKKEADDLNKAQKCLDEVPQSDPAQAENCFAYVEKYTSQQANILKCGIKMTSGGLIETKVVKAYQALKDSTQSNKTAAYMAVLSLDIPDVDTGYTKAVEANNFCRDSGVPGLIYISSIIVSGTYMNKVIKAQTGSGIDINNPASINTAVNNMLTQCTTNPPPASCTTDLTTLGTTVTTVAGIYCDKASADQNICSSVNSAVNSANGNSSEVGQALFCYLKNKTYNPTTKACN